MLLVQWYENPAMIAGGIVSLSYGLSAVLTQLEARALSYKTFEGLSGVGAISLTGAQVGDTVEELIGIVGITGDQSSAFEAVITVDDEIQQISTSDLTGKFYRAYLVPLSSL
jgi:hypothetical protein